MYTTARDTQQSAGRVLIVPPKGFSLIELLIVVAIILILAGIAIPSLIQSRMRANEAAAVASCRNINTAEVVYHSTYNIGYSVLLVHLGDAGPPTSLAAALLDNPLANGAKFGFTFLYGSTDLDGDGRRDVYTINANPTNPGSSGQRFFFTDQTGVIRWKNLAVAAVADPPI